MSDARTQAIHKAASELVAELLNSTGENGGEPWYPIIVRKMKGLPPVNEKLIKDVQDLLFRVRVLLYEDVEDYELDNKSHCAGRHRACIEEIDRLLEETKLPK